MEISPVNQALLMAMCGLLGVAVGIMADTALELCIPLPKRIRGIGRFIGDFCCVATVFLGIIILSFYFDKGRVRFFEFLGVLVGFTAYRLSLSRLVRWLVRKVICLILYFFNILLLPCHFLWKKVKKIIQICKFYICKSLAKTKYMLYNIYNNIIILKWAEYGFSPRRRKK